VTYSRAQRYGSRARMLGRAQVSRLKAGILTGGNEVGVYVCVAMV
jgi:hypothetical protein